MINQYLVDDNENRESRATKIIVDNGLHYFAENLNMILPPYLIITELNKDVYGRDGDVDISFYQIKNDSDSFTLSAPIGIEVKACYYDEQEQILKSTKVDGHIKQLHKLERENWEYIVMCDIIVLPPHYNYYDERIWDAIEQFYRDVDVSKYGHLIFLKTGVNGRLEEDTGGVGFKLMQPPIQRAVQSNNEMVKSITDFAKKCGVKADGCSYKIYNSYKKNRVQKVIRTDGVINLPVDGVM